MEREMSETVSREMTSENDIAPFCYSSEDDTTTFAVHTH